MKYFKSKPAQSFFYAAVLIIFSVTAVILFVWSLIFIVKLINSIVITKDEELPVLAFNFTDSTVLSRKLGIVFPAEIQEISSSTKTITEEPIFLSSSSEIFSSSETIPTLSEISVQILNGTDTKGLAKSWGEKFKTAGFLKIETGNADKKDEQGTQISYKPSKKEALDSVKNVLISNNIEASLITEKESAESENFDFTIIIGK